MMKDEMAELDAPHWERPSWDDQPSVETAAGEPDDWHACRRQDEEPPKPQYDAFMRVIRR
jgi:hypothetical protein